MLKNGYDDIFGEWEVSICCNWNGKQKIIGRFIGYVDEIALHLSERTNDELNFKRIASDPPKLKPTRSYAHVQFDIESGSWDIGEDPKILEDLKHSFSARPVEISRSNYYGSFKITNDAETVKQKALSKLSTEEKEILGLN